MGVSFFLSFFFLFASFFWYWISHNDYHQVFLLFFHIVVSVGWSFGSWRLSPYGAAFLLLHIFG